MVNYVTPQCQGLTLGKSISGVYWELLWDSKTKSVQLIPRGWCPCKEHRVRPSSCPQTMKSWGNEDDKLLEGRKHVCKKRKGQWSYIYSNQGLNQDSPAETKPGPMHFLNSLLQGPVTALCDDRVTGLTAGQGLPGETWGKAEAYRTLYLRLDASGTITRGWSCSTSRRCTKKCLEILQCDLSGASAFQHLWEVSQKDCRLCDLLSETPEGRMGPESLGIGVVLIPQSGVEWRKRWHRVLLLACAGGGAGQSHSWALTIWAADRQTWGPVTEEQLMPEPREVFFSESEH